MVATQDPQLATRAYAKDPTKGPGKFTPCLPLLLPLMAAQHSGPPKAGGILNVPISFLQTSTRQLPAS